jgi:hypothetical protein
VGQLEVSGEHNLGKLEFQRRLIQTQQRELDELRREVAKLRLFAFGPNGQLRRCDGDSYEDGCGDRRGNYSGHDSASFQETPRPFQPSTAVVAAAPRAPPDGSYCFAAETMTPPAQLAPAARISSAAHSPFDLASQSGESVALLANSRATAAAHFLNQILAQSPNSATTASTSDTTAAQEASPASSCEPARGPLQQGQEDSPSPIEALGELLPSNEFDVPRIRFQERASVPAATRALPRPSLMFGNEDSSVFPLLQHPKADAKPLLDMDEAESVLEIMAKYRLRKVS